MKNFIFKSCSFVAILFISLGCSSDSDSETVTLNCQEGFTGDLCTTPITPKKIKISKIRVTGFPNTKTDGYLWDAVLPGYTNPDIFQF